MKNITKEKEFKEFLKGLKDIQLVCFYCLFYEEMNRRGFIESRFKL